MQYNNIGNMRVPQNYRKTTMAFSQFLTPNDINGPQSRTQTKKFTTFQPKSTDSHQISNTPAFLQNRKTNPIHHSMIFDSGYPNQLSSFQNPFSNIQDTKMTVEDPKKKKQQVPSFLKNDLRNPKDQANGRISLFEKNKSPEPLKTFDRTIFAQNTLKSSGNIKNYLDTGKQIFSPIHPKRIFPNTYQSPNLNLQNKEPSINQKEKDQKSDQKSTLTTSQKSSKIPEFLKKGSPINKSRKGSDSEKLKNSDQLFSIKKVSNQTGQEFQSPRERKSSAVQTKYSGFKNYVETQSFNKKPNNVTSASFAKISSTPQNHPVKLENFNFEFGRLSSPSSLLNRRRVESNAPVVKKFTLNDFELVDKIGKGAFGDVFISRQKTTGFLCVLKKISKRKIRQQKLEETIMREIKIQSFLKHKHLTELFGFFDDEQYLYLILQILPDGSMSQVKKKRRVGEKETSRYLRQVCEGLRYMHKQEIIHRDLKPENIFMNQDYLKIGDFGCAIYTHTLRNTIVGCIAYISPEQLNNQSYDEKIDAWSVGVLTYELIFGKAPFQSNLAKMNTFQLEIEHLKLQFPSNLQISNDCKNFISNLLALDPNQRMTIDEAIKHPFITKCLDHDRKNQKQVFGQYLTL